MSQELRDHARRLGSADHAAQAAAVDWVREQLRPRYEEAKRKLAELEKETPGILREVEEIEADLVPAGRRRPDISQWTREIRCILLGGSRHPNGSPLASAAEQIRQGIRAFEGLTFADLVWKDGVQLDVSRRNAFISTVGSWLRKWDGALSFARAQLGQMRTYVKEWHEADPGPPTSAVVGIIREERPAGIVVETGGGPRPPL